MIKSKDKMVFVHLNKLCSYHRLHPFLVPIYPQCHICQQPHIIVIFLFTYTYNSSRLMSQSYGEHTNEQHLMTNSRGAQSTKNKTSQRGKRGCNKQEYPRLDLVNLDLVKYSI